MLTIALVVSSHYLAVIQSLQIEPAAIPAPTTLAELLRNNITIYVDPANLEDMQRIRAQEGEFTNAALREKWIMLVDASELLPTLRKALDDEAVSVIACPVDYGENARLVQRLGALEEAI